MSKSFSFAVPITKCFIRKAEDGTEKYIVEGLASTTSLDLTGERMAESAITSMAKSIETHPIYLNSEHRTDWDSDFGEVVKLTETPAHEMYMEAELDPDHYRTKTLVKGLNKGKQLGLSIEGEVIEAGYEWMDDVKRAVKTYKNVLLKKISVTGTPAVPETWLNAIAKSVDWSDAPTMTKSDTTKETTQTVTEQTQVAPAVTETKETTIETTKETPEVTTHVEVEQPNVAESTTTFDISPASPEVTKTDPDVIADAPEQKVEDASTAPETPTDPAEADTTVTKPEETQKAQYLGEYAEADATTSVIDDLSDSLSWQIFMTIADDEMDAATQIATVDAMLGEFHAIALKVATALIESDAAGDAAEAAKSAKSRLDKTEAVQAEALTKSLTAKDEELATVHKTVETLTAERDAAIQKAQTLAEKEALVNKRKNVLLFSKFTDPEGTQETQTATEGSTLKSWMESQIGSITYSTE